MISRPGRGDASPLAGAPFEGPKRALIGRVVVCRADRIGMPAAGWAHALTRGSALTVEAAPPGRLRLRMVEPCTCGVRHEAEFEHAPASLPPGFAFEVRG